jgi:NhaA family Na+:H+ antiporter
MNDPTYSRETFLASNRPFARVVARPMARFLAIEAAGGILLLAATVIALVWANSPWSESYFDLWATPVGFRIGDFEIQEPLQAWVNDLGMAIFFFVVGLEIKRELTTGQLTDRRAAAFPAIAALGGMVVPAAIYLAFNWGGEGADGWGIPMATDIAFALGVVALLGPRVPSSLKVFLLTLAIVDDLGAIAVIAIFYTERLSVGWGVIAIGLIVLVMISRRMNVWYVPIYVIIAAILWVAVFESGVHATIAGVVLGLLAPTVALRDGADSERIGEILSKDGPLGVGDVDEATFAIRETVPVNDRLEHFLHPWTSYVIIPVFALANAGIVLSTDSIERAASSPITIGILLGLVVGKTIGVGGAALISTKLGLTSLPRGVTGMHMVGISLAAGIGFTVSIFISGLAFGSGAHGETAAHGEEAAVATAEEVSESEHSQELQDDSKIGILAASMLAAGLAAIILARAGNDEDIRDDSPSARAAT